MRVIKFQTWEGPFASAIQALRGSELLKVLQANRIRVYK
jgi:hypothetical protein